MNRNVMERMAWTLIVLSALGLRGGAQEPATPAAPPPSAASAAQRVLLAAYPELCDRRIDWRIDDKGTTQVVEAREALLPVSPPSLPSATVEPIVAPDATAPPAPAAPPLVRALVDLDVDGAVVALRTEGTLARPPAFTAAQTAADPLDALRTAGAKFPLDAPAGPIGLVPDRLAQLLGSTAAATPTFKPATPGDLEGLTWQVELTGAADKVTPHTYTLVFEPIEGRLLSVVRR